MQYIVQQATWYRLRLIPPRVLLVVAFAAFSGVSTIGICRSGSRGSRCQVGVGGVGKKMKFKRSPPVGLNSIYRIYFFSRMRLPPPNEYLGSRRPIRRRINYSIQVLYYRTYLKTRSCTSGSLRHSLFCVGTLY